MAELPGGDQGESMPETAEPSAPAGELASRWSLIALIANNEREPVADISDHHAQSTWAAVSTLWHPALLARVSALPRVESLDEPSAPEAGEIRLLAPGMADRLPSGYRVQAEDAGAVLIEGEPDRPELA